jgi:hypothetical protein
MIMALPRALNVCIRTDGHFTEGAKERRSFSFIVSGMLGMTWCHMSPVAMASTNNKPM